MKSSKQKVPFERTALCSRVALDAIYLDLIALLFEPNAQLLQASTGGHTAAEREALIGLRLLASLSDYPYPYANSALEKAISRASADLLIEAEALLQKLGAMPLLKKFQLLIALRSRLIKAQAEQSVIEKARSNNGLPMLSEKEEKLTERIAMGAFNSQTQLMQKLWLYLDSQASNLRGGYSAEQRWAANKPQIGEFPTQTVDFQTGKLHVICSSSTYLSELPGLLDWPGAVAFDADGDIVEQPLDRKNSYKIAYIGAPLALSDRVSSSDVDALAERMIWVCRFGFPSQFISTSLEFTQKFCAALESASQARASSVNRAVLSRYTGVSMPSKCGHGISFAEAKCGEPAVIAAKFEQCGVWLIIKMEQHCYWFLDWTQHWQCKLFCNDFFLCWSDSADAIRAAFSRISSDDNICWGAVSGRLSEDELHRLTIKNFDAFENAVYRSKLSGWAYLQQWGGGADEHFSIFHAQDLALTDRIAAYAAQASSQGFHLTRF